MISSSSDVFSVNSKSDQTSTYGIAAEQTETAWDEITFNYTPSGTLSETGSGEEFLPPYMIVYAWYRSA